MRTDSFEGFFRKATASRDLPGREPYPYQTAFAVSESIPALLNVPTGVGKTATAILGWVYRRRAHPTAAVRSATPRRLVYCLPMRTLVEQTERVAREWLENLKLSDEIDVHLLMGGNASGDWDRNSGHEAILIGTQDMLLSRALNRGYGMSRSQWGMRKGPIVEIPFLYA